MSDLTPWLESLPEEERAVRLQYLRDNAYIIRLTFGRSRIVVDLQPNTFYEQEFW